MRHFIEDQRATALVSAVSDREAAVKRALGKLRVPDDLPDCLDEFAFGRLPVADVHAWAVHALPAVHSDPSTACWWRASM